MNNKAKIGVIAGNFDVIHPGYIHLFNECKKYCSQLIIFLHEEIDVYLKYYNKIDIGLDTFPYSGSTTTYAALTMGVPVITLTGNNYISRLAASVLSGAGLSEWIVRKENEYIKTLKKLVNFKTISNVRATLRKQLIKSHLCDGKDFATNFENFMKKIVGN